MPLYESHLRNLISAVGTVKNIPGMSFPFPTSAGDRLTLDAKALVRADQLAQALVAELAAKTQLPATGVRLGGIRSQILPSGAAQDCPAYAGDPNAYDTNLCWVQRFFENLVPGQNPKVEEEMRKALAGLVVAMVPVLPYIPHQILAGVLGTFFVSYTVTGKQPPGGDVIEAIGTSGMDTWGKTNGMLGFVTSILHILQTAATTYPSQGPIELGKGVAVSDYAGNNYLLFPDGAKLVQVPLVQGSFPVSSISGLQLVVPPTPVLPSGGSIYEGTYTGVFNYEYQQILPPVDGKEVRGPWVAKSLTVEITLKAVPFMSEQVIDGRKAIVHYVTHVFVNDPVFGTGVSGIDLAPGPSFAYLPADPPANLASPAPMGHIIVIGFPNGASIKTIIVGKESREGNLFVSWDGKILSSSTDPYFANMNWEAKLPQGRLLGWSGDPNAKLEYRFTSWKLNKKLTQ
jgi:hypothetical protein